MDSLVTKRILTAIATRTPRGAWLPFAFSPSDQARMGTT
jgi:hypothetical protein